MRHVHSVGLPWASDQPVAEAFTYATQQTNIHAPSRTRTRDPSKRVVADLRLRQRGHWDKPLESFNFVKETH